MAGFPFVGTSRPLLCRTVLWNGRVGAPETRNVWRNERVALLGQKQWWVRTQQSMTRERIITHRASARTLVRAFTAFRQEQNWPALTFIAHAILPRK